MGHARIIKNGEREYSITHNEYIALIRYVFYQNPEKIKRKAVLSVYKEFDYKLTNKEKNDTPTIKLIESIREKLLEQFR